MVGLSEVTIGSQVSKLFSVGILNGITNYSSTPGFTEVPTAQNNVTIGKVIMFRCQHASAYTITWIFDGSFIGSNPPSGVTVGHTRDENNNLVHTLRVNALLQYNGTVIECVAFIWNATTHLYNQKTTRPIVLIIKGLQLCLYIVPS